jgi:hypothetical protein
VVSQVSVVVPVLSVLSVAAHEAEPSVLSVAPHEASAAVAELSVVSVVGPEVSVVEPSVVSVAVAGVSVVVPVDVAEALSAGIESEDETALSAAGC